MRRGLWGGEGEGETARCGGGALTAANVFGPNGLVCRWTSDHGATHYVFDLKGNVAQYAYANGTYNNADLRCIWAQLR